jgi:hypothetical protein
MKELFLIAPEKPSSDETIGLLRYPAENAMGQGLVAVAHRAQPSLEIPGIAYYGRSINASFGLEGINNLPGKTGRAELLKTFLDWAFDEPEVTLGATAPAAHETPLMRFSAQLSSNIEGTDGISFRWDFGDGTPFTEALARPIAEHSYERCGIYTVRVEAADSWGNRVVESAEFEVPACREAGYRVNVHKRGSGTGSVVGQGIDCGEDCSAVYSDKTLLHLKALRGEDSRFSGWFIDGNQIDGLFSVTRDTEVEAVFDLE